MIDDKGGKGERIHWILQSWSYYVKLTFARHKHKDDTDRTQTERGCSRRQLFGHYCGSSALRYNRVDPLKRVPAHSIRSPNIGPSAMSLSKFQSIFLCVVCCHFICTRKFISSAAIPPFVFSLFLYKMMITPNKLLLKSRYVTFSIE